MKNYYSLQEVIENLRIGDYVSFSKKGSFFKVTGEVVDFYLLNNRFYITIFSYYKREKNRFILNENLELVEPKKRNKNEDRIMVFKDSDENKSAPLFIKRFFIKSISLLMIVSFFFLYYPHTLFFLFSPKMSYNEFLSKNYSLNELYHVVTSRLVYQSDLAGDYWDTPEYAWEKQSGDCEEFASICADYLTHHNIENFLVGLQTKDPKVGHAVVFVELNNVYYIIDPTNALEGTGVKKIENCTSLRDAVSRYSSLPSEVYKVPSFENDKKVIYYIY